MAETGKKLTKDDIIRMAREAGFHVTDRDALETEWLRFAALVATAEREACAKVCDEMALSPAHFATMAEWRAYREGVEKITIAIRARGQK